MTTYSTPLSVASPKATRALPVVMDEDSVGVLSEGASVISDSKDNEGLSNACGVTVRL
jgi:hypothetical protein